MSHNHDHTLLRFVRLIPLLLALLLAFLTHLNVLQNGFGWDDESVIQDLRLPKHGRQIASLFLPYPSAKQDTPYFRPVVELSYLLDYALWGDRPFGFHLSVLLGHLLNTTLVFFLARALLNVHRYSLNVNRSGTPTINESQLTNSTLPLIASSLFAVHPIHAEAVAWIAGRNDVFCTAFMLASMIFYLRFHVTGRWTAHGLAMLSFALALLTKETAVGLLLLFPLTDHFVIPPDSVFRWRKITFHWLVPLMIFCAYFSIRSLKITMPYGEASLSDVFPSTMISRMIGAAGLYLKVMAFPYPHHPFIVTLPTSTLSIIIASLSWVLLLGGTVLMLLRRNAFIGLGLAWTALTIVPAISGPVLHLSVPAAERYLYAPSAGFSIAIVWLILEGIDKLKTITAWTPRRIWLTAGIILTAVIITLGWESRNRNTVWKSPLTFWETVVNTSPQTGLPYHNLAEIYGSQGNFDKAERFYQQASVIWEKTSNYPHMASSLNDLAMLYHSQGRYTEAEPVYRRSLTIREKVLGPEHPDVASSLNNLGVLYRAQGRYTEAEILYRQALMITEKALRPDDPKLATILENYANLLRKTQRKAEATTMEAHAKMIRAKQDREIPTE